MYIVAPATNHSLCSSPPLSTPHATRRSAIQCLPNLTSSTRPLLLKHSIRIPRASSSSFPFATEESQPSKSEASGEGSEYEVELENPYGLKFMKGSEGATYIDTIAPGNKADKSGKFTVGDKVIATWFAFASLFFQQTVLFNPDKNHFWREVIGRTKNLSN